MWTLAKTSFTPQKRDFIEYFRLKMDGYDQLPDKLKKYIIKRQMTKTCHYYKRHRQEFTLLKIVCIMLFSFSHYTKSGIKEYFVMELIQVKDKDPVDFQRKTKKFKGRITYYLIMNKQFENLSRLFGGDMESFLWNNVRMYGKTRAPIISVIKSGKHKVFEEVIKKYREECVGDKSKVYTLILAIMTSAKKKMESKKNMLRTLFKTVFLYIFEIKILSSISFNIIGEKNGALHNVLLKLRWFKEANYYRQLLIKHERFDATEIVKDFIEVAHYKETTIANIILTYNIDAYREYYALHDTGREKCALVNSFASNRSCFGYLRTLYIHQMIKTNFNPRANILLLTIRTTDSYQICPSLNRNICVMYVAGEVFESLMEENVHCCDGSSIKTYKSMDQLICPFQGVNIENQCFAFRSKNRFFPSLKQIARKGIRDSLRKVDRNVNMIEAMISLRRKYPSLLCRYILYNYLDEDQFNFLSY